MNVEEILMERADSRGVDQVPAATVQVVRDMDGIERLREWWTRLAWHPNSDIDFYRAVLESMSGASPWVLALQRNGVTEVILVGRLEETRQKIRIGYLAIPGPKTRTLMFIFGGLLGDCSAKDAGLLAGRIQQALRDGDADAVVLNHLRTDSLLYACVAPHSGSYWPLQTHRAMTVPQTAAGMWERFSPKVRKNLKWQMRRFEREFPGGIHIERMGKPAELDRLISDIERVAAKTYQRGLGAGFNASPGERERLRLKAEKGWLQVWVLYVRDEPCSFWGGTLYGGVFHSEWMGYDSEFQQYSPGMHLILRVIEEFCKERGNVKSIDFGMGDAQYKRLLGDCEWQDGSPIRFAPTLRGALFNACRAPLVAVDWAGRALLSADLQQKIKRFWRDRIRGRLAARQVGRVSGSIVPNKQVAAMHGQPHS